MWTPGDVSGSQTLDGAPERDHLYASHINELRESTSAQAVVGRNLNAQYYCNGADDHVQIQQALDEVSRQGGGDVYVRGGNFYDIDIDYLQLPINVNLRGSGYGTWFKGKAAGIAVKLADGTALSVLNVHNEIEGIRFTGNFANFTAIDCGQYSQEFAVTRCWFQTMGSGSACINAAGTNKKFRIIGNQFGGGGGGIYYAIRLSATGDVQIVGNDIHDFFIGIYGNTEKTNIVGNDIYSDDNTYVGSGTAGISLGVSVGGLTQINMSGNTISDCEYGVKLGLATGQGANISNNYFRNIANNAAYIRGLDHRFSDNYLQNVAVTGSGNDSHGVLLADDAARCQVSQLRIFNSHSNMGYAVAILDTAGTGNTVADIDSVGAQTATVRTGTVGQKNIFRNIQNVNPDTFVASSTIATTKTVSRANGAYQSFTMTGDVTFTFTNGIVRGDIMVIELTQDATGSRLATWPSNFKKAGGTLTLSTAANAVDTIKVRWNGTNWVEISRALNVS